MLQPIEQTNDHHLLKSELLLIDPVGMLIVLLLIDLVTNGSVQNEVTFNFC